MYNHIDNLVLATEIQTATSKNLNLRLNYLLYKCLKLLYNILDKLKKT